MIQDGPSTAILNFMESYHFEAEEHMLNFRWLCALFLVYINNYFWASQAPAKWIGVREILVCRP